MNSFDMHLIDEVIIVKLEQPIEHQQAVEILKQISSFGCDMIEEFCNGNCNFIIGFEFDFSGLSITKEQVLDVFDILFMLIMLG